MVYLDILFHITEEYPEQFRETAVLFVNSGIQKLIATGHALGSDQRGTRHDWGTIHTLLRARQRFHSRRSVRVSTQEGLEQAGIRLRHIHFSAGLDSVGLPYRLCFLSGTNNKTSFSSFVLPSSVPLCLTLLSWTLRCVQY